MMGSDLLDLILQQDPIGLTIEIVLLCLSIFCWAIIFYKLVSFRRITKANRRFLHLFSQTKDWEGLKRLLRRIPDAPFAVLFKIGQEQLSTDSEWIYSEQERAERLKSVERTLRGTLLEETSRFEEHLSFLAITTTIAPLLGLLGTVWGVVLVFLDMGQKGVVNIATIGPGVATALLTTAFGILTAIPAAVSFAVFMNKIRIFEAQMESFITRFIRMAEKKIRKEKVEVTDEAQPLRGPDPPDSPD